MAYIISLLLFVLCVTPSSATLRNAALTNPLHRPIPPTTTAHSISNDKLPIVSAGQPSTSFWNVPNVMSVGRLLSVPPFIAAMAMKQNHIALVLFVVSALTDWLDGYIARLYKITSKFGAFIDPVADKLLVTSALIMLLPYYPTMQFAIPVAVIICREIFVSGLREWMSEGGKRSAVKVSNWGKLKTVFQMISTALLMYSIAPISAVDKLIAPEKILIAGKNLFTASAVLSVLSAAEYAAAAIKASR